MSREKGIKGKGNKITTRDIINHREEIEAGKWGEEARQELIEADRRMEELVRNENLQRAIARMKRARQLLDYASNRKASMGLHLFGFLYFDGIGDMSKCKACFEMLLKKLKRRLKQRGIKYLSECSDDDDIKNSEISITIVQHVKDYKYLEKPFVRAIEFAEDGKLDGLIFTVVFRRFANLIDEKKAQKRGSDLEKLEFDEKYADLPRRRDNGKIDQSYQNGISVDFDNPSYGVEEDVAELRQAVNETGKRILSFIIEYFVKCEEAPSTDIIAKGLGLSKRTVQQYRKDFRKKK